MFRLIPAFKTARNAVICVTESKTRSSAARLEHSLTASS